MLTQPRTFEKLSGFLAANRSLWETSPFIHRVQPWHTEFPGLADVVHNLPDGDVCVLEAQPQALIAALDCHIGGLADITALCSLPESTAAFPAALEPRLSVGVPGRKWAQIQAFSGAVVLPEKTQGVLDWCAGKSHLGRALARHHNLSLHAVEKDQQLCADGEALAKPWIEQVQFSCKDVLEDTVTIPGQHAVVALHACGDLHRRLLFQWFQSPSACLVLAPCCYHKWLRGNYQPLSKLARAHDLKLTQVQVQQAVQEMVTASPREQKQVQQMQIARLGFDVLQRKLSGRDEYVNTPSLPYGVLSEGVEGVIQILADKKGITVPDHVTLSDYAELGYRRYQNFRRDQLVTHGFRHLLEAWLLSDIYHVLSEQGCEVAVTRFCERALSPRNTCFTAVKTAPQADKTT